MRDIYASPGDDRHMLIVDRDHRILYELYALRWTGSRWEAGSGATFPLDANSQVLTVDSTAFRLDVNVGAGSPITFTRTGAFSGTITRNGPGTATFAVGLFHVPQNHFDFGPHNVQATVQ